MGEATIEAVKEALDGTAGKKLESYNFAAFEVKTISREIVRA